MGDCCPAVVVAGQPFVVVVEPRQAPAIVVAAGGQGPAGPPGRNGDTLPAIAFSFGDATPRLLHVLESEALLLSLSLIIEQGFDGEGSALQIRAGGAMILMSTSQNSTQSPATYETTPGAALPAGTGIYLEITPGAGATAGAGFVVLNLN
jgi:hypothetical protein